MLSGSLLVVVSRLVFANFVSSINFVWNVSSFTLLINKIEQIYLCDLFEALFTEN